MKYPVKKLSSLLEQRLSAYTLAATAAGAGAVCFAQLAEAKIVYTPADVRILPDKGMFWIDLNHDGIPDFGMSNRYSTITRVSSRFWNLELRIVPLARANEFSAKRNFFYYAYALPKGAKIGPAGRFQSEYYYSGIMVRAGGGPNGTFTYGYWRAETAYLGLKFVIKGNTHFGWARVQVTHRTPHGYNATLTGYAYETIPGKAIIAGETNGPDVVMVRPDGATGSLGRLAMGRK